MFLKILAYILFSIATARTLYFYQLKEYRFDRLYDFFKYDKGLRTVFSIPIVIFYFVAAIAFILKSPIIDWLLLFLLCIHLVYSYSKFGFIRFKPTIKGLIIFGISQIFLLFFLSLNYSVSLIAILNPILICTVILFLYPITRIAKEITINKAKKKLSKYHNLKIIGVTGSYGKSSTKEFVAQILSFNNKFKVLKTPGNINTDIGVAKLILKELQEDHQVLIVEMGAYKIGEIANIVKMMPLDFAIISAISPQHLTLFGSLKNIQIAKSEIASNLKPDGLLYLNSDSKGIAEILKTFELTKVITYGLDLCKIAKDHLQVSNINEDFQKSQISFKLNADEFKANTLPKHNAFNLAPVIDIALKLGLSLADIKMALLNLTQSKNSFNIIYSNKLTIIDDSYNSNVEGFTSAVLTLKNIAADSSDKLKILITMGMIELGEQSKALHTQVASNCDFFDYIILTKKEIADFFPNHAVVIEDPNLIISYLDQVLTKEAVILIENRLNPKVKNYLKNFS